MKVLLASSPIAGHLNPLLVAAGMLKNAGHETALYTGSLFRGKIEAAGVRFFPLPADVDFDLRDLGAAFPEWKQYTPGPQQLLYSMKNIFVNAMPSQFRGLEAILQEFPADVVVHENCFFGVLPLLLGTRSPRPVSACLSITTLPLPREDGAPTGPGLPPATNATRREQFRSIARDFAATLTNPVREYADQILDELGVQRLPGPIVESTAALSDLILQPCVPSFEFPFRQAPGNKVHFIGSLLPQGLGDVPPQVKEAKDAGRSIVLVSQGTVVNDDLGRLVAPVIQALGEHKDKLLLVTTGGKSIDSIPCPLSPNTVAVPFLNFGKVFPQVDVLVALGGYGTVTQALSCGIPMVLAGHGQDKPEIAARVAWTGSGIRLDTGRPTADQLRDAVEQVLSDPAYRIRAKTLAQEFAAHDAARELPLLLETLVADRQAVSPGTKVRDDSNDARRPRSARRPA
jgi:UDP:flavonoid glycosyltransferase YjiC (YdhE family)